jgi:methylmalonyl-CoA/ethylmalonyl-CoA epimerase
MNLTNATVSQLLVPVDDLAKGVSFYRDVLGLPFLFEAPPQMAFFNCGGIRLLLGVPPPGQAAHRGSAIYFRVSEIGAVFSTLKEAGVVFSAEPHVVHKTPSTELWLAEFRDPFGNSLALTSEVKSGGV